MPLTSADKAFSIIALEKKALTKDVLAAREAEVEARLEKGEVISLAAHLVEKGSIDETKRADLERVRARHGRTCEGCLKITFLLPGEAVAKKPCEHCGGKLKAAAPAPAAAPAAQPAAAAVARVAVSAAPAPAPVAEPAPAKPVSGRIAVSAAPTVPTPVDDETAAKARAERARKLRQAGAFGYEPSVPEPARRPTEPAPPMASPVEPPPVAAPASAAEAIAAPAPRFAIRGAVPAAAPEAGFAPAPAPSSGIDEMLRILAFPIRGGALPLITVGAVFAGFFSFFRWGYFFLLLYFHAFQIKVANEVTAGKEEVSDWPDVGEIAGLGWKLFLCEIACLLPSILLVFAAWAMPSSHPKSVDFETTASIGPDAHLRAGRNPKIVGADVAAEIVYDLQDSPVRLGERKGRWLVLGLLGKDVGDDTGTASAMANMPKAGVAGLYLPDCQCYDLSRLQRAVKDVDVAAIFIDPRERLLVENGLKDPPGFAGERPDAHEESEEEGFERTKPVKIDDLPIPKSPRARRGAPPGFKGLRVWRTHEFLMPGAFANPRQTTPCVWIIDPKGKVRREFEGGADDQAIWGSLHNLQGGGDGDSGRRSLPGSSSDSNISGLVGVLALLMAVVFAWLYHPMAFLMTVVFNNGLVPFNYFAGVASIKATARPYFFNVLVLVAATVASALVSFVISLTLRLFLGEIIQSFFMSFVSWWLLLYTFLVEAYALGRFYVKNQAVLGWFTPAAPSAPADAHAWRPQQ